MAVQSCQGCTAESQDIPVALGWNPQLRGRETAEAAESSDYPEALTLSVAGDMLHSCLRKCYLSFLQVLSSKARSRDWLLLRCPAWLCFFQIWESGNELYIKNAQE